MNGFNPLGAKVLGFAQVTSLSSAKALTPPEGAAWALVNAEAKSVRWRADDTAPTATVGMLIPADDTQVIQADDLSKVQFIETAASATLNVTYYAATGGALRA